MERNSSGPAGPRTSRIERQLAPLKIISRLLGHELRTSQGARLTMTRDSLMEIQTSLDMYIESMLRTRSGQVASSTRSVNEVEVQPVSSRVN